MAKRSTRVDSLHLSRGSSAYERLIAKQTDKTSSRKRISSSNISAQSSSEKNASKAGRKKPKVRRPRPPVQVFNYNNVICYFDEDSGLVAQETVHQTSAAFDAKRRKKNPGPEDDLVALYYLMDPVSLREVTVRTSTLHVGLIVDKAGYRWREDMEGLRVTEACKTQRMCATHMVVGRTVTTPVIVVDTKKLSVLVLFAEKKKVLVRWDNQDVFLSQWDSFLMNAADEFQIQNLSTRVVAQLQYVEWRN